MWWKRMNGCQKTVQDWSKLLRVHSLVLEPQHDSKPWLKFASLCRRNGRMVSERCVQTRTYGIMIYHEFIKPCHTCYETTIHHHALPCTTLHYLALPCTTMHYLALPCTTLHYLALPCTTMHYLALSCTTLHYHALPCTTLHYHALSCTTLHYHALPYTTMHCHVLGQY